MRDMLYLNGELVDLSDGVDITLNYKSNMLTDLGKIVGNNSYTIKLPKTSRNLRIIGCADVPSVVSSFPRVSHPARYFRNGVELVPDGRAVLLSVGDSIEIVMTWGNTSALFNLLEDGKNLTEIEGVEDYVYWNDSVTAYPYNGTDEVLFSTINLNLNAISPGAALHPSVRSTYIFNLLKLKYGLSVEFPEESKEFVNSLIFPLLTRNGGYANRMNNQGYYLLSDLSGGNAVIKGGDDFDNMFELLDGGTSLGTLGFKVKADCRVVVTPSFKSLFIGASLQHGADSFLENTIYLHYSIVTEHGVTLYHYDTPVEVDLMAGDNFRIEANYPIATGINGIMYNFGAQPKEILLGDKFPIVENLPDIKIVDFIKAIASMAGLFAVPSRDGNTIKFVPFNALGNRINALDWSDKLIPRGHTNTPIGIRYTLDEFAKNNRMKYAEDDTVATWADGNIIVGDDTLDYERDAVTLPFSPTDSRLGYASIKLYEYDDEGVPELQDVEYRVLREINMGGYSTGTFEGLHWSTLIANHYSTYQDVVKSPVLITENILLDEVSLRDLDMSVPVYLRQYGRYYAVVEVKAPSNGVCECKLLQLSV